MAMMDLLIEGKHCEREGIPTLVIASLRFVLEGGTSVCILLLQD